MMLNRQDINSLKSMNAPPATQEIAECTMGLWLLILDSFGVEVSAKSKSLINEALQHKGSFKSKAQKYSALFTWKVMAQELKDVKLAHKL